MKIDLNDTELLVLNIIIGDYSDFIKDNKDKIPNTSTIDSDSYIKIINNIKSKLFTHVFILLKTNKKLREIINNKN